MAAGTHFYSHNTYVIEDEGCCYIPLLAFPQHFFTLKGLPKVGSSGKIFAL
jgi:hypothetical protein